MVRLLSLVALAAPLVAAIEFTDPAANATLTKGQNYDLTWSTVDTDPSLFSIYLVNFFNWPPSYQLLAENVETGSGAASVRVPCNIDNSWGYQFNAINGTNVYVIYAQTPKFSIGGADCVDPTPAETCPPAATVTVSKTLSVKASVTTVITRITKAVCPATIGWSSGYDHPVTLTEVPHPPGVTAAPTGPAANENFATTSTIYSTVFRDLSEGCGAC
ncbi:hypothetical protein DL546_000798 [Coniochaeta pulveracea]|uniref:Yeast cell wall synthesis Kre9/Knh1-like N-terminal domain-containing protein n=1 Tax=Coniochaeta pulveracea TaxID=177199 RepID=A0A420XYG0_9PEZI|nr:hypothetical protein DL546_000798 [Coniochaeta pulveracea]